jgi:colanic acid/amylovoran biosynthesis glycosyltransferase
VRIIYVTAFLPHGSDEAFLIPEIKQLMRSGHEVLVVPRSPRGRILHGQELFKWTRGEALHSIRVLKAAVAETLAAPSQTAGAVRLLFGGRSSMLTIKNLAIVPKAFWLARLATLWRADHIHCHWAGTTATMTMLASWRSGIPWSFTAHRWDIVENNLLARKAAMASFVRLISGDGLRIARALGLGSANNTRVIHMGVPIPNKVRRQHGPRPVVLCPARLVEVKGHRFLLEAWQTLRRRGMDAELWLAGQGELRARLETLSKALGLTGSVKFLGAVPHDDLLKIYAEAPISAVVLASVDLGSGVHEGIPVALIEAMSYGIPAVATATGGTPELLVPGTGLLVPPADPTALADALQTLLRDGKLREQLGDSGRRRVVEVHDISQVAAELVKEFEAATRTAPEAGDGASVVDKIRAFPCDVPYQT